MNLSLFSSSNPNKILRNLMEQPCNNYCIDCGEPSASNVDCTHYTFVCVSCSAIHREIGDKIKSVGVSTFTPEEIERLQRTSNDDFNNTWMSGFKRGDQPLLPASNEETRRTFIQAKYRQKRWHKDTPKMTYQSHRTMFPTEDDSDDEIRNTKTTKNEYYPSNKQHFDNYNNDNNITNNYNENQRQTQQNFPRGNPFENNSQPLPQQNLNYQPQQNTQYVQNNFNNQPTNLNTQLSASSKNAPFQRHKSSDHTHKKTQLAFQQQNQSQPHFQQQNQDDLLIDFMTPQPQNSNMQSAIDDIFGPMGHQQQQQQQQYQQSTQNQYQQQQQSLYQQQQQIQQPRQTLYQQQQISQPQQTSYQQSQQIQLQSSFPRKKQNQNGSQQAPQIQNSSMDNIIDLSYNPTNQPQNQQTDDLLNFYLPNETAPSHINDDELLDFSNPQIAAQQQQQFEKRRQLKEAMVNISDDDMRNIPGNNSVEKLRNEGLGVQDSPTFMAKALIASGYCSQPPNQPIPRMGMQPPQQMYYGSYQGYPQSQTQYYKPQ